MSKLLTVFGATGNQGGSVIRSLLADATLASQYRIRAITRDTSKKSAQDLKARGCEVVSADLSDASSVKTALEGSHTVFLVTNFWETMNSEIEVNQGKTVADAAKAVNVQHIIFSTLINVTESSAGRFPNVKHFDGKNDIEQYIRKTGIPATFFSPGFFMSNFLQQIKKNQEGEYALVLPVSGSKAQLPLLDVSEDTGKFVKAAIKAYPAMTGEIIYGAQDYYTPDRILAEFSQVTGKKAKFTQVPQDTFKSFLPAPTAQELLENMLILEDPGYYNGAELAASVALLEEPATTWKDFVARHQSSWE